MNKLTFNIIGIAILGILLALNALSIIELGHSLWLAIAFIFVGATNVIGTKRAEERSDG